MAKDKPNKGGGGNSHQRTVVRTKARQNNGTATQAAGDAEVGAADINTPESKHVALSRSSLEAYAFAFITILLTVLPMTWWLRGLGLLVLVPIAIDVIRHSPWTHQFKSLTKIIMCAASVIIVLIVVSVVVPKEYGKEHALASLSPPPQAASFAVTQGVTYMASSFLDTSYWVPSIGAPKKEMTPISVMGFFIITNTKSTPATISHLSVEINGASHSWWKLNAISTPALVWTGQRDGSKRVAAASELTLSDGFLVNNAANRELQPGQSVKGWMLCQLPASYVPFRDVMQTRLRLTVGDTAGDIETKSLRTQEGGSIIHSSMHITPLYNVDLNAFEVIPYGVEE